jgi:SAM-dependent methyltransferase
MVDEFLGMFGDQLQSLSIGARFPSFEPMPGEQFVMKSFSTEWLAYDFDGVIWEMSYSDHERRFLSELDGYAPTAPDGGFLEVGCGIGITTEMAQRNFGVDAVGVDLSLAALRAASHYSGNPFLHFVQASAFNLPFQASSFRTIYSRGVLHHTYSTQKAFESVARCCAAGGTVYLWVYGPGSVSETRFRKVAFAFERPIRKLVSKNASSTLANSILWPMSLAYVAFNHARRLRDPSIQPYTIRRALHAARDRFTPEFAYRHDSSEVSRWFHEAGLREVEVVDWRRMPSADHDDYRRNTGVRGRMPLSKSGGT